MKNRYPEFDCLDCKKNTMGNDYYMVNDITWLQATLPNPKGMLCLRCLGLRLGRNLKKKDFTSAPVNFWITSKYLNLINKQNEMVRQTTNRKLKTAKKIPKR